MTDSTDEKKVVMSRAARRKLKKPAVAVTTEMKEQSRQELRELRKHLRMVKSNGGRRKIRKEQEKRKREENDITGAASHLDEDARPLKKGRRLESGYVPPVQTLPDSMLPPTAKAEVEAAVTPAVAPAAPSRRAEKKGGRSKRQLEDEVWN